MIFERFFQNSEARQGKFAVYKCNACGHIEWLPVSNPPFQTTPRPCPVCKAEDGGDARRELERRRDELAKEIEIRQAERDQVLVELEVMESGKKKEATPCLSKVS